MLCSFHSPDEFRTNVIINVLPSPFCVRDVMYSADSVFTVSLTGVL